ncbi:MAG: WG repeat-containing protein [Acidobacteriia bacterium]|nr:WG repeat-containing protein [Terriglobia bacterium]
MVVRLLLALFLLVPAAASQGSGGRARRIPFEEDGLWGYKDVHGGVVIKPRFLLAEEFSPEGIAPVVDDSGWAYINAEGKVVIRPFVVDNGPDYFSEGLARFTREGKFGFFDKRARVVIPPKYDFASPFSEGFAAFCEGCKEEPVGEHRIVRGGKWGFINRKGEVVIPPKFDEVEVFQGGRARAKWDGQWRSIDKRGRVMRDDSIGSATMEADGTIVLQLRAEGPNGQIGNGLLRYPPTHPRYQEVLRHLGGLKKGEVKAVRPWPEK